MNKVMQGEHLFFKGTPGKRLLYYDEVSYCYPCFADKEAELREIGQAHIVNGETGFAHIPQPSHCFQSLGPCS